MQWLCNRWSINLKARQIGFSTLVAVFAGWDAAFHRDKPILMLSRTEREAIKLLSKTKYVLQHLPPYVKERLGPVRMTQTKIEFSNGSYVESLPSASDPARGESASLIICDEMAFIPNQAEAWAAIEPVAQVGGRVIMLSTAYGEGNTFHDLWAGAQAGSNRFAPLFFPWSAAADRDEEWYEQQRRDLPEWQLAQEYPCIAKGTMVGTPDGLVPIEQARLATTYGAISANLPKGRKETVELVTDGGTVLRCTPEHRLLQPDGSWVEAQHATEVVLGPPMLAADPCVVRLASMPATATSLEITPEVGRWFGYFMGDGSICNATLSLVGDRRDLDVIEDWQKLTKSLWGVDTQTRVVGSRDGGIEARCSSKAIAELLDDLDCTYPSGAQGARRRRVHVPDFIKQSPHDVVAEFLKGLFEADGWQSPTSHAVKLFSKHLDFVREVKLLLQSFGLHFRIREQSSDMGDGYVLAGYGIEAIEFNDRIGFISERKRRARHEGGTRRGRPRFVEKVESCMPAGVVEVYDLEITKTHRFDAAGVVVHNCNPEEAFLKSGMPVFDLDVLRKVAVSKPQWVGNIVEGKAVEFPQGDLCVWSPAEAGGRYVVGCDVAVGLEHGDFSAAHVIDVRNGRVVARYKGKMDPDLLGEKFLPVLGRMYGNALIGVESNNHGLTTLKYLQRSGYHPIYYDRNQKTKKVRKTESLGFRTTQSTKPLIIDKLNQAIRDGLAVSDKHTLQELKTFVRDGNGKMGGSPHDDLVMSLAIANHMRSFAFSPEFVVEDVPDPYSFAGWERRLYGQDFQQLIAAPKSGQRAPRPKIGTNYVRRG